MNDFTNDERRYLVSLLEAAHTQLIHELHHTDSREFQRALREQISINEQLLNKVVHPHAA